MVSAKISLAAVSPWIPQFGPRCRWRLRRRRLWRRLRRRHRWRQDRESGCHTCWLRRCSNAACLRGGDFCWLLHGFQPPHFEHFDKCQGGRLQLRRARQGRGTDPLDRFAVPRLPKASQSQAATSHILASFSHRRSSHLPTVGCMRRREHLRAAC